MSKTQLIKNIRKQKKFKSWDEAFRGLTPVMRQHSVRVADYTKVLFQGVCKSSYYMRSRETPVYMEESYLELAYKCGFYHQIGKAFDPDGYTDWQQSFTEEEKRAYCRYTVEGRQLVEKLQGEYGEDATIPSKMIQEACEQHMERWDGEGYPYGYVGDEISLIAQIVSLAKELDRLLCQRKSESPFDEAIDLLIADEGKMFSPNLIEVLRTNQSELKNVYRKYIQYTRIMPKTVPLVDKRPERPFGLNYRQIILGAGMENMFFEAVPWFGGVLEDSGKKESAELVEELLERAELLADTTFYFLYEAADTLARMKNCELYTGGVLVPVMSAFYSGTDQSEKFRKFYEDTAIEKEKLLLTVQECLLKNNHSVCQQLSEYIAQGVVLVLDDYHPADVPVELIRNIGFTHIRLALDLEIQKEAKELIEELNSHGIIVLNHPTGDTYLSEEELIQYLLSYE